MAQPPKSREDYEREERNQQFQHWWRRHGAERVARLPAPHQHDIHKLIKAAYMKGAKMEAQKNEPVRVGGE